ncbi:MAG TPA: hypothetical protein VH083_06180 [Myxococcales bacterium]|nr:hypothetical protein [Myxococcales bacterium]
MPQPPLSPQERRLATFCRLFAAICLLGALGAAVGLLLHELSPWNGLLGAALLASLATSCLVAAGRPRERRHALLPVVAAIFTISLLGAFQQGQRTLLAGSVPLLLISLFIYRSAAPGVHSEPAREGPPAAEPEPADRKIQLGIKSN